MECEGYLYLNFSFIFVIEKIYFILNYMYVCVSVHVVIQLCALACVPVPLETRRGYVIP